MLVWIDGRAPYGRTQLHALTLELSVLVAPYVVASLGACCTTPLAFCACTGAATRSENTARRKGIGDYAVLHRCVLMEEMGEHSVGFLHARTASAIPRSAYGQSHPSTGTRGLKEAWNIQLSDELLLGGEMPSRRGFRQEARENGPILLEAQYRSVSATTRATWSREAEAQTTKG